MTGIISSADIIRLKQPCENRKAAMVNNGDGTIAINGNEFDRLIDAEIFLESIPRMNF